MRRQPSGGALRRQRGAAAEGLAAAYLENRGVAVLARNVGCKTGEIDLVCRDGEVLAMVEVRQRCSRDFGGALASVTRRKQRKIIRAAGFLLQRNAAWQRCLLRFDVIGVLGLPDCAPEFEWIKDAFRAT